MKARLIDADNGGEAFGQLSGVMMGREIGLRPNDGEAELKPRHFDDNRRIFDWPCSVSSLCRNEHMKIVLAIDATSTLLYVFTDLGWEVGEWLRLLMLPQDQRCLLRHQQQL